METLIDLAYYVSTLGFVIATVVTFNAARAASQSGLKTVLNYLSIGTATFFVITIFHKLAEAGTFGISAESTDVWWHIMFYMAMISFYIGFKSLAKLGTSDAGGVSASGGLSTVWVTATIIVLVTAFVFASSSESVMQAYNSSKAGELGLHHFLAFALAGVVGAYLFSAKLFLGQIGRAIAGPMIITVWALAAQHFWELLFESWKVVVITSEAGEGIERIFLLIAAAGITVSAMRLRSLSKTA